MIQEFLRVCRKYSEKTAVIDRKSTLTYSQLRYAVLNLADYLGRVCGTDKRLLLYCENSAEFVVSYFAVALSGNTAVLCDINFKEELSHIIRDCAVDAVLTTHYLKESFTKKQGNSLPLHVVEILFSDPPANMEWGYFPDKVCVVLYTSGTTGSPKGTLNTGRTLLQAAENYISTLDVTPEDRFLATIPLYHSYAMGSAMLASLLSGATLVIDRRFDAKKALEDIRRYQVSIFHGVPYMYDILTKHLSLFPEKIESIRYFVSAGMRLPPETFDAFFDASGHIIHQEYGSSETGTIAFNRSCEMEILKTSVGQPLRGVEVRLAGQEGSACGEGILEMYSKGESLGYFGGKSFSPWYRMADRVRIDGQHNIFILGRQDRILNIAGKKVDPAEIEALIMTMDGVKEVHVGPKEEQGASVSLQADVVAEESSKINKTMIRKLCAERLSGYKIPKHIRFVQSLPKSSLGKPIAGKEGPQT